MNLLTGSMVTESYLWKNLKIHFQEKPGLMTPVLGSFTEISQPVNHIVQDVIRMDTIEVSV